MSDFVKVADIEEIPPFGRKSLVFEGRAVLVFRIDDDYYAVEDVCTHDGEPLTDGALQGTLLECPRHGGRFDVRTGRAVRMPAISPVRVYEVCVAGNDVLIRDPA